MADILIVEDSDSSRALFGKLFTLKGHNVTPCEDFAQAQQALCRRTSPFAAIVTDWNYPGIVDVASGVTDAASGGANLLNFLDKNPPYRPQHLLVGSDEKAAGAIKSWAHITPKPEVYVKGHLPGQFNDAIKKLSTKLKLTP